MLGSSRSAGSPSACRCYYQKHPRLSGLEILGTRVYRANVAASILNGVRDIFFVLGDVVQEAEAQCRDAALIWDSLGYGAENGGTDRGLAGATRGQTGLRAGYV